MNVKMDILINGQNIIYNDLGDGFIEEPLSVVVQQRGEDMGIFLAPMLVFSESAKVKKHDDSMVMYSFTPVSRLYNKYVEELKDIRTTRTGIVAPTDKQILNIIKK